MRLITALRSCLYRVFNNDDDNSNNNNNNNNNKLYQKQVTNFFLSFGKEINMSSTEIERTAGEFYFNTASLIEPVYMEKCNV